PRLVSLGRGPGHRAVDLERAARRHRPSRERGRHARSPRFEAAERYLRGWVRRGRFDRRGTGPAGRRVGETEVPVLPPGFWSAVARARALVRAPLARRRRFAALIRSGGPRNDPLREAGVIRA